MEDKDKLCCLTLDEMEITPAVEYDPSSKRIMGDITLPGTSGPASHGLVFMLGGKKYTSLQIPREVICKNGKYLTC